MNWRRTNFESKAERYAFECSGSLISFRDFFEGLQSESQVASVLRSAMQASTFDAYFWELPAITEATLDTAMEFTLTGTEAFNGIDADSSPFRDQFIKASRVGEHHATAFSSLGGDAMLVAPIPGFPQENWPELSTFTASASDTAWFALWRLVAQTIRPMIGSQPIWLSTSGLGVFWLHVRIDSIPKYYVHRPYIDC